MSMSSYSCAYYIMIMYLQIIYIKVRLAVGGALLMPLSNGLAPPRPVGFRTITQANGPPLMTMSRWQQQLSRGRHISSLISCQRKCQKGRWWINSAPPDAEPHTPTPPASLPSWLEETRPPPPGGRGCTPRRWRRWGVS